MVILFPKFDIPGYFPRVCGCWCVYTPVYLIELYTLLNINLLLIEIFIFKSQTGFLTGIAVYLAWTLVFQYSLCLWLEDIYVE